MSKYIYILLSLLQLHRPRCILPSILHVVYCDTITTWVPLWFISPQLSILMLVKCNKYYISIYLIVKSPEMWRCRKSFLQLCIKLNSINCLTGHYREAGININNIKPNYYTSPWFSRSFYQTSSGRTSELWPRPSQIYLHWARWRSISQK